jgi:hypothetical protein
MLKSYEALLDHGQIRWLESPPDVEEARVIVTVLPVDFFERGDNPGYSNDDIGAIRSARMG